MQFDLWPGRLSITVMTTRDSFKRNSKDIPFVVLMKSFHYLPFSLFEMHFQRTFLKIFEGSVWDLKFNIFSKLDIPLLWQFFSSPSANIQFVKM